MGLVERWWGREQHLGDDWRLGCRVLSVSDVLEVRDAMAQLGRDVRVFEVRWLSPHDYQDNGPDIVDLPKASDFALGRVGIAVWGQARSPDVFPDLVVQLGRNVPPRMYGSLNIDDQVRINEVKSVMQRVSELIRRGRRPFVTRAMVRDLAKAAVWLGLLALVVWLAVAVWPLIPAVLLALVVWVFASVSWGRRVDLWVERHAAHSLSRVIVKYEVRPDLRQKRRERQRVILGFFTGAAVAVIGALVTAWLA